MTWALSDAAKCLKFFRQELIELSELFGVIAMQSDLIERQQFVDTCTLWTSRKESALADGPGHHQA